MVRKAAVVLGFCLALSGCGYINDTEVQEHETNGATVEVLPKPEDFEVIPLEGEPVSPDGKWEVSLHGVRATTTSGGFYAPESVQILDRETGEVLWEDMGYYQQRVLWSSGSKYVAIARTARTYGFVTVIETEHWTSWDVTPPEGSNIPQYTFLPEKGWGAWVYNELMDENLTVTIGRGGEEGPQTVFRCHLHMEEEQLTGISYEQTSEVLGEEYDFDHDGVPEAVEVVTIHDPAHAELAALYEVRVWEQGKLLWRDEAHWSHVGWNSIFAVEIDEEAYLIRYLPGMWQGWADYHYQIFSLDESGQEVIFQENHVSFDTNYQDELHQFDAAALAAFLQEIHGYLDTSVLLLTTENGEFRSGGSGAAFQDDINFWTDFLPYDETLTLEENLQVVDDFHMEMIAKRDPEAE